MIKKYFVSLTAEQIKELNEILNHGKHNARKMKRAQVLLLAQAGKKDKEIASIVGMNCTSIGLLRRRFVEEGYEPTLNGGAHRLLKEEDEAILLALAGEEKPDGNYDWTLRNLRDQFVTLDGLKVSHETIRRVLKRNGIKLQYRKKYS